jgi:hypothetical protein
MFHEIKVLISRKEDHNCGSYLLHFECTYSRAGSADVIPHGIARYPLGKYIQPYKNLFLKMTDRNRARQKHERVILINRRHPGTAQIQSGEPARMDILARRTRARIDYAISKSEIDVLAPNNEIPLSGRTGRVAKCICIKMARAFVVSLGHRGGGADHKFDAHGVVGIRYEQAS